MTYQLSQNKECETHEVWKSVPNYPNYEVSSFGRIKSLKRKGFPRDKILKKSFDKDGYHHVRLYRNKKGKMFTVHKLVTLAFIGKRNSGEQVNHLDGNKTNNHVTNLEYCTGIENMRHAYSMGLIPSQKGITGGYVKLTREKVLKIRETYANGGISQEKLGEKYGVSRGAIFAIIHRITWKHI